MRQDARRAFAKLQASGELSFAELISATECFADQTRTWPKDQRQYIPYPASWLNGGSYADEPDEDIGANMASIPEPTRGPRDEEESAARHFLMQLAQVLSKTTRLRDRHVKLEKLAFTDELTGLFNGRFLRFRLREILKEARTTYFPVTLFLFDIDDFKRYNDQYGHGVGDEILRQTAKLMKKCVRSHDIVARISGDEFAVVFWEKEGPRERFDRLAAPSPAERPRDPSAPIQGISRVPPSVRARRSLCAR